MRLLYVIIQNRFLLAKNAFVRRGFRKMLHP